MCPAHSEFPFAAEIFALRRAHGIPTLAETDVAGVAKPGALAGQRRHREKLVVATMITDLRHGARPLERRRQLRY